MAYRRKGSGGRGRRGYSRGRAGGTARKSRGRTMRSGRSGGHTLRLVIQNTSGQEVTPEALRQQFVSKLQTGPRKAAM